MIEKVKGFITKMNEKGIPIPMIRVDGKPSITATMVFLSFNNALLGQIGKLAGAVGGVDLSQANYLFISCLGAYLGRKMMGDGKKVEIAESSEQKK